MSGLRGTAHPSSKLTEDQVREIRRLLKAGQSLAELAKKIWRQPHRHSQHRQWPQMEVVG